jgi:hypothetical protein
MDFGHGRVVPLLACLGKYGTYTHQESGGSGTTQQPSKVQRTCLSVFFHVCMVFQFWL